MLFQPPEPIIMPSEWQLNIPVQLLFEKQLIAGSPITRMAICQLGIFSQR